MRVFLFRGLAGKFFSTGLDNLAEKLGAAGHTVSIHSWIERTAVEADTISQAKSGKIPTSIAIAGHSLGGNSANYMARNLAAAGVPVSYVATIDPTEPEPAPAGVRCDNFRSRDFRAEKVEGATDHLREDLNHIEIDKDDAVHRQILDACNTVPAVLMSLTQSVNAADGEVAMLMEKLGLNKQTGGTAS